MSKNKFAFQKHTIGTGKPGKGQPGEGKHKAISKGVGGHPTPAALNGGHVALNGGMDPGTQVSPAVARNSSTKKLAKDNIRRGSAFLAMRAAKGGQ